MAAANPVPHAKIAADALTRLVREVQNGQAQWSHPHLVRQGTDELTRAADAIATALQQLSAALGQLDTGPRSARPNPAVGPLHLAGQAVTTAAAQLRQACRTMH